VLVLLLVSQACSPGVSAPDSNAVNTAIAQTIVAGLTQSATSFAPSPIPETPASTFTPELPTASSTATLSPTPVFSATLAVPQISVSVATNCRVGPGRVYDRVGALLVGEVAEVAGRNPTGNYWLIRNPRGDGHCWLWGEYATLTGNLDVLPVYTPPPTPTPTPNFAAFYDGRESCTGTGWWVDIELENTGGVTFRSMSLTVRDLDTEIVVSRIADNFTDNSGCLASVSRDTLAPGVEHVVSSPAFAYDFIGHRLRATITLCSNRGLSGTCVTQVINFTP
jgi:hypothetical protein